MVENAMDVRQKAAVEEAAKPDRVLAMGVVQVLGSVDGAWQATSFAGIAALHAGEHGARVSFFRCGASGATPVLETRLDVYPELEYVEQTSTLHCFEVDDGMLGLNFLSAGEARVFSTNVKGFLLMQSRSPRGEHQHQQQATGGPPPVPSSAKRSLVSRPAAPAIPDDVSPRQRKGNASPAPMAASTDDLGSVSPRVRKSPLPPATNSAANSPQVQRHATPSPSLSRGSGVAAKKNSSGGVGGGSGAILSFFKSFGGGKNKLSESGGLRPEDVVISAPASFEHRAHVGWDAQNGFDVKNLPAEWKSLFKSAGLKKKDLADGETALFVMSHIAEQLTTQQQQPEHSSPPPVVRRAAPPPVPSTASRRGTIGGSPAPAVASASPLPPPARSPVAARPAGDRDSLNAPADDAPSPPPVARRDVAPPSVPQHHQTPPPPPPLAPLQANRRPPPIPIEHAAPVVHAPVSVSAPPPPPPPPVLDESFYGSSSSSPPPPPPPKAESPRSANVGASSLADQLGTVKLKKVDVEAMKQGALPKLDQKTSDGLAGSLAMALANRRGAIAPTTQADGDSDSDWSD